jgi:aminoglycoside 3-N-acetyltransferase
MPTRRCTWPSYRARKHITVLREGIPTRIEYAENDHCCRRFALADEWLRSAGLQAEGPVGSAHGRLLRSQDVVRLAVERLRCDPLLFLDPSGSGCRECDEARVSVDRSS